MVLNFSLISSIYGIFVNFRDIWQNIFRTPNFEVRFQPFSIDDRPWKTRGKYFFENYVSRQISSESVIFTLRYVLLLVKHGNINNSESYDFIS